MVWSLLTSFRIGGGVLTSFCWPLAHTSFSAIPFSLGGGVVVYLFRLSLSLSAVVCVPVYCVYCAVVPFLSVFSLSLSLSASLTPLLSISMTIKNGI